MSLFDKATVFDLQSSSFVDGPGIRTTVFFKGCNLKCKWCHNPEGISFERQIMVYKNKCTGCGKCSEVCQNKPCVFCGRCIEICPNDARKICGEVWSLEDVFEKVERDKLFYEASGGGVTCSGGECMLQIEFLAKLLCLCKKNNINTAVDTAGCVAWESFETILPYTDLFLYDIKCISPELHVRGTGVDNSLILENYLRLIDKAAVCVRIPIIDGFNTDENELQKISDFLNQHPPKEIQLLSYHAMGEHKYAALNIVKENFKVPIEEVINTMRRMLLPASN